MKAVPFFFLLFCALVGTVNAGDSLVVLTPVEKFFEEFSRIVPAPKDEFETSEQYEARCAKSRWTEGLVYLKVVDRTWTSRKSGVVYDADKQEFMITAGGHYSYADPWKLFSYNQPNTDYTMVLRDSAMNVGTYTATNAMGATAEITRTQATVYWMKINNAKTCEKQKLCIKQEYPLTVEFQMEYAVAPEEARQLKSALCIVIGILPDTNTCNAYFTDTGMTREATITEPYEVTTTGYLICADLREVLLYDEKRGVVLKKLALK